MYVQSCKWEGYLRSIHLDAISIFFIVVCVYGAVNWVWTQLWCWLIEPVIKSLAIDLTRCRRLMIDSYSITVHPRLCGITGDVAPIYISHSLITISVIFITSVIHYLSTHCSSVSISCKALIELFFIQNFY